jgi:hypothetical protein
MVTLGAGPGIGPRGGVGGGGETRNDFIPSYLRPQLDDVVGDLAMSALRKESKQNGINSGLQPGLGDEADWGDGSWISPLLSHHISQHYQQILKPLTSRSIIPVPLRIHEITPQKELSYLVGDMERIFRQLPETKRVVSTPSTGSGPFGATGKGMSKGKTDKGTKKQNNNGKKNQKQQKKQQQQKKKGSSQNKA